jgi:hypothetical protein
MHRWRPQGNQRPVPVLLACGIQNDTPGDYNITFSVTNSAGLSASTRRRITIKAVCPPGEALCADKVSRQDLIGAENCLCSDSCAELDL